jgi:hypothetical protein
VEGIVESTKIVDVGLNIDQNFLKAAVQDIVNAALVKSLGDPAELVRQAIDRTINQKVDSDGKITRDEYRSEPYLNWLAKRVVTDTVKEAVMQMVKEHAPALKAELLHQLRTQRFQQNMAAQFLETVEKAAVDTWKMPISVEFVLPNKSRD